MVEQTSQAVDPGFRLRGTHLTSLAHAGAHPAACHGCTSEAASRSCGVKQRQDGTHASCVGAVYVWGRGAGRTACAHVAEGLVGRERQGPQGGEAGEGRQGLHPLPLLGCVPRDLAPLAYVQQRQTDRQRQQRRQVCAARGVPGMSIIRTPNLEWYIKNIRLNYVGM